MKTISGDFVSFSTAETSALLESLPYFVVKVLNEKEYKNNPKSDCIKIFSHVIFSSFYVMKILSNFCILSLSNNKNIQRNQCEDSKDRKEY